MVDLEIIRWPGLLDYEEGVALQHAYRADVVAGRSPGVVVLCEHPSVYTAGRRTEPSDLPTDGSPVVEVDRGGRITWHGPGQLVAYPIVRLAEPLDVVAWVRDLEQVVLDTAASLGLAAERVPGRSGVWLPRSGDDGTGSGARGVPRSRTLDKVGAIGLHVAEQVSSHGIAINCDNDLAPYAAIVPCGIADAGVTTLSRATGRHVSVDEVAADVGHRIERAVEGMRTGDRISTTSTTSTSTDATRQEITA
ncbi:lipoyl(octanoyl) transferase LipB [Curtobacterium sp. MCBA15_012]|uniref:lipoyl(octanoyl) transferase LipB n=1 Tax=Curtobacterium sp. MCBA15_012 TaxID=1898738 RepID=UPI0008DCF39A|nr:lipoyl(octanoyl) transferase LipB [Curtobacterium sp. MCBA15_012]WIA98908.1 lipoyl(octanoyl) transferase LipB [Curtobacterium sp. MCBA15_012]